MCNPTSGQLVFQYFQKGFFTNQNKDGTYNLTVKVSPEGAGTAGDNAKLKAGATKTLWEKPNEGYYFTGWTTNPKDVKIDSKNTLTMPAANVTATANFSNSVGFVNLTVKSSPEGAGTVTGGGNKRLIDGKAIFSGITETPNKNAPEESHWQFDHWGVTQGDNVAPDSKSNITIIKDTTLVAYFKLINDSQPVNVGGDENSTLTINSTVAAAWHNADDLTISDAGAAIAKEGQLVTFDVKTASNDFRYTERLNDLYFGHSYPPDKYFDYNSGFQGNLEHVSRQYHSYSTKHHYYWWWTADYWGHIYREPVKWYSAFQLNFTFPDELTNPPVGDLNPALQKNLNTNLNPDGTMLWYIQSNPFIVLNNSVEYDNAFNTNYEHENHAYEQWKQNEEKIEFYVPLTTPITVEDDGTRIREPYKIKIQGVETNGKITATTYVNLDVKGNIYKGIYTTPVG
ncbi:InlB B-repeat-containing protein [Clostridium coskatii]|uniref:Bacterial repeat domain-containing protein n=1 Tax=Clostridium coskatii TaxID=1705578 RepID=A0A162KSL8_9CLOT|nr:hypothetical protein [Clostridium coskatii]OAA86352.1 hypothetical protein WX73_02846 [Clostridium coskatii]OBR95081.1 hypothetical protein CLCOS_17860 [Clostridium coskatii]